MDNIAFFPAHPAQLWIMYSLAKSKPTNVKIFWYIRDKDIMVELAQKLNIDYMLVSQAKTGFFGNAIELFLNIFKFLYYTRKDKIQIWFSKYGSVNIAAWLLRKKNFSFNDDDADIVPFIAITSYPFSKNVFCTNWTRMGKYEKYAIRYPSFHELFYLHPNRFEANAKKAYKLLNLSKNQSYVLIRLSSLQAHHDLDQKGITDEQLSQIVRLIEPKHAVYISSERPLKPQFEKFRIKIPPQEIHNILACADFFLGDSQTMIAEAAILGTPNLRISSFKGKLGYINELERRTLTSSVSPNDKKKIISSIEYLMNNTTKLDQQRSQLLSETIDPVEFIWKELIK